jgi:hypothetical protein
MKTSTEEEYMIISVAERLAEELNYEFNNKKDEDAEMKNDRYYLDALQIRFREKNQVQIVNIDPENLELFKDAHPDYEFISIVRVRRWILR